MRRPKGRLLDSRPRFTASFDLELETFYALLLRLSALGVGDTVQRSVISRVAMWSAIQAHLRGNPPVRQMLYKPHVSCILSSLWSQTSSGLTLISSTIGTPRALLRPGPAALDSHRGPSTPMPADRTEHDSLPPLRRALHFLDCEVARGFWWQVSVRVWSFGVFASSAKQHDTRIDGELWRFVGATSDHLPAPGL